MHENLKLHAYNSISYEVLHILSQLEKNYSLKIISKVKYSQNFFRVEISRKF